MLLPVPTDQQQPTASTRQYTRSPTSELSTLSLIVVACLPDQRHLLQANCRHDDTHRHEPSPRHRRCPSPRSTTKRHHVLHRDTNQTTASTRQSIRSLTSELSPRSLTSELSTNTTTRRHERTDIRTDIRTVTDKRLEPRPQHNAS